MAMANAAISAEDSSDDRDGEDEVGRVELPSLDDVRQRRHAVWVAEGADHRQAERQREEERDDRERRRDQQQADRAAGDAGRAGGTATVRIAQARGLLGRRQACRPPAVSDGVDRSPLAGPDACRAGGSASFPRGSWRVGRRRDALGVDPRSPARGAPPRVAHGGSCMSTEGRASAACRDAAWRRSPLPRLAGPLDACRAWLFQHDPLVALDDVGEVLRQRERPAKVREVLPARCR